MRESFVRAEGGWIIGMTRRPGEAARAALPPEVVSPQRTAMGLRPRGLIVSGDDTLAVRWAGWLEREGLEAVLCPGPDIVQCPRFAGHPCGFRQLADVTIVDVRPRTTAPLYEHSPERSCTTEPDDGRTIFVLDPRIHERHGAGIQLRHPVARTGFSLTIRAATD
jgi:hypothetical protein